MGVITVHQTTYVYEPIPDNGDDEEEDDGNGHDRYRWVYKRLNKPTRIILLAEITCDIRKLEFRSFPLKTRSQKRYGSSQGRFIIIGGNGANYGYTAVNRDILNQLIDSIVATKTDDVDLTSVFALIDRMEENEHWQTPLLREWKANVETHPVTRKPKNKHVTMFD